MNDRTISSYTWWAFGIAVGITALAATLITLGVGGDMGRIAVSDIHEAIVVGIAAVATLRAARRLDLKTALGRTWLLIGIGALMYVIGDVIWTVIEVVQRQEVPYPGVPDVFYLLEYPFMGAGIISAGFAFRALVPTRREALVAAGSGVVLSIIAYVGFLKPYVLGAPGISAGETALSILYPLGDITLMIAPAVFVLLVMRHLGGGKLAWPWRAVATGSVIIALSDTAYSWLAAYDKYASGNPIDYGWGIGHAFIMLGALIARDMAKGRG